MSAGSEMAFMGSGSASFALVNYEGGHWQATDVCQPSRRIRVATWLPMKAISKHLESKS